VFKQNIFGFMINTFQPVVVKTAFNLSRRKFRKQIFSSEKISSCVNISELEQKFFGLLEKEFGLAVKIARRVRGVFVP